MNRNDWEAQVFASNMNTTARMIAVVVGTFGNWVNDKTVEPGTTKIAAMAGVTRDTVDEYLNAMVEQGWLKPVGTGRYNTTIYELCEVVADTTGILARTKRKMNPRSLAKMNNLVADTTDNSEAVDGNVVADTSGVSCRYQPGKLPKADPVVADSTDSNLKNLHKNLDEPTSPAAPVAEIREEQGTDHTSLMSEGVEKVFPLSGPEKKDFDHLVLMLRATPEQASGAKKVLEASPRRGVFNERATTVFKTVGVEVEEVW